jgi:hypothetical protein
MFKTRRTVLSALGAAGIATGAVAASSESGEETTSTDPTVEPNAVVELSREAPVRSPDDTDEQYVVREGQAARARWPTTIDGEEYWRVDFGRKQSAYVRVDDLVAREPAFEVGDTVENTTSTSVWPSVPPYFDGDDDDITTIERGRTGTITKPQFMIWGSIWWRVDWDAPVSGSEPVSGWTTEDSIAAEDTPRSFAMNEVVTPVVETEVRRSPTLDKLTTAGKTLLGTVDQSATGTVVEGYKTADDYAWWKINWGEDGPTGWSPQRFLDSTA